MTTLLSACERCFTENIVAGRARAYDTPHPFQLLPHLWTVGPCEVCHAPNVYRLRIVMGTAAAPKPEAKRIDTPVAGIPIQGLGLFDGWGMRDGS